MLSAEIRISQNLGRFLKSQALEYNAYIQRSFMSTSLVSNGRTVSCETCSKVHIKLQRYRTFLRNLFFAVWNFKESFVDFFNRFFEIMEPLFLERIL